MKELAIDLWETDAQVICITTNGSVTNGVNPMGAGCAGEAAKRHPWLRLYHGMLIEAGGVNVYLVPERMVMFPTKWRLEQPASLDLVVRSAGQLVQMANLYGWKRVALPRPGSGLGGLDWAMVRPALFSILDDRFTIIRYPGERL